MKLFRHEASRKKEDIERIKEIRSILDGSAKPDAMIPPKPQSKLDKRPVAAPAIPDVQAKKETASPPLFIKIDRYKDIVREIQDLRSLSLTLRDALDALFEMEKEIKGGLEMTQKTLDGFNTTLLALDGSLIRSQGIDIEPSEDSRELEEYVRNVYKQVQKIRNDMNTISSDL